MYKGQFQRFQVGEHNLQQLLIIYSSKLVKRNEENNNAQTSNSDEVQTQNDAVKTWEYLNDARVYSRDHLAQVVF